MTRSGIFCALATVIDCSKMERVVDVFQTVKMIRSHMPGAVPNIVSDTIKLGVYPC